MQLNRFLLARLHGAMVLKVWFLDYLYGPQLGLRTEGL